MPTDSALKLAEALDVLLAAKGDSPPEASPQTPAANDPPPAPAAAPVTPDNPQLADVGVADEQAVGPMPPPGKAPLRTYADVEALSDAEFDARHAEVQAVLRAGGQ